MAPKPRRVGRIAPLDEKREAARLAELEMPETDDAFSPRGCRWPVGEVGAADFRFCQRPKGKRLDGRTSPFCQAHHNLGHVRSSEERDDFAVFVPRGGFNGTG